MRTQTTYLECWYRNLEIVDRTSWRSKMKNAIENMRIHFYGVQGSGAVFPRKRERDVIRQYSDIELLKKVFTRLSEESDDGVISLNAIFYPFNS